jgi:putative oxidoreductase
MTQAHWDVSQPYSRPLSLPLAERVAGGAVIWLAGRVVLGGLFLMSGLEKFGGLNQFAAALVKGGIPEEISLLMAAIAAGAEVVGGLCIVLGFATSWAALLMIVFTIAAAFVAHRYWQAPPEIAESQLHHFQKNVMIVAGFCLLYVAGGGPYSIDRWWRRLR